MQTFQAATASSKNVARNIFRLIENEMMLVEQEFARRLGSKDSVVNYLSEHLQSSRGKRLRPALLILANRAIPGASNETNVVRLAAVMEMLHTATLVHDDIIDNSDRRRDQESVNAKFGNHNAVLMGDWLYMSAFETSLEERSLEVLEILTQLTRKMTEGELIQLSLLERTDISEGDYFDIVNRKTAYLFASCCEIGAFLGDAEIEQRIALREYGRNLGILFQLADDLLDFTSDESILGKAAGADLLEGKLTLPLILLRSKDDGLTKWLTEVIERGSYKDGERESILESLRVHGILDRVRDTACEFAKRARKNLEILPESEYRLALEELPTYMIERRR